MNNGQSSVNNEIRDFCDSIPEINSIDDLKELDQIFFEYFSRDTSTPKFSRSVIDIFNSKTFSGCSDIGMMMATILREKGIPTIYVETANVDWLNKEINNLPGHEVMQGHIFLEILLDEKWYLYDPTFHVVYDNYDSSNNNYPRRYYVFAKGENANSLGVYNVKDERALAISKLGNYDCNEYVDPNYTEINLRTSKLNKTSVR
jgi:hypothetical protein